MDARARARGVGRSDRKCHDRVARRFDPCDVDVCELQGEGTGSTPNPRPRLAHGAQHLQQHPMGQRGDDVETTIHLRLRGHRHEGSPHSNHDLEDQRRQPEEQRRPDFGRIGDHTKQPISDKNQGGSTRFGHGHRTEQTHGLPRRTSRPHIQNLQPVYQPRRSELRHPGTRRILEGNRADARCALGTSTDQRQAIQRGHSASDRGIPPANRHVHVARL